MHAHKALSWIAVALAGTLASAQAFSPSEASAGGPPNPPARIAIVGAEESGEPLLLTGTIVGPDGAPVSGARLYVYQTDAGGIYSAEGPRRPRLRGWLKTGSDGRYELRTIRPGHYPGSRIAAHIHATLQAPGRPERWIDEYHFEGDPYLSAAEKSKAAGQGRFASVVRLERGQDGVWRGERDLRVED